MRLALRGCGRKLEIYLGRRSRMKKEAERRSVFERYIGEISKACEAVTGMDGEKIYKALQEQAAKKTAEADTKLDEDGNVLEPSSRLDDDEQVIILKDAIAETEDDNDSEGSLFESTRLASPSARAKKKKSKSRKKTTRKVR